MSPSRLILQLKSERIQASVEGGRLILKGEKPPPPALRKAIVEERDSLVAYLETGIDTPPGITAFEERAALLEYDGGLPREQAERGAAVALGYETPDAFYSAVIAYWRACIERAEPPERFPHRRWYDQLYGAAASFLASREALEAMRAGWCELALFGAFEGRVEAARARVGAQGIITMLGWSALGVSLVELDRNGATLRTKTGAVLHRPKHQSEINISAPWWLLRFEEVPR